MHQAIDTLHNYDIPTHSFISAVKYLNESEGEILPDLYRYRIKELTDQDTQASDETVRWHYLYLVQETVRQSLKSDSIDMNEMFELATTKAETHLKRNPWLTGERKDSTPKFDAAGNPKKKKGAKREMAISLWKKHKDENKTRKEWIELLVEEVGLTTAGASTYHSNLKSGRWN